MSTEIQTSVLSRAEPVLPVKNIIETIDYWHDVIGFTNKWTWGEPPYHGGVSWHDVAVQFFQNPEMASAIMGNSIFIRVSNVESLYQFHKNNKANIVEPLENKPWGLSAYTLKDINGYYLDFAGTLVPDGKKSDPLPPAVKIISRTPTAVEYTNLVISVGWNQSDSATVGKILEAPAFAVVAEDSATNEVIGCGLLLSDNASFYYFKDIMVHPSWQRKHVGFMLMRELTQWLDKNAPSNAYVGLFTGESLAPFYRQFDFSPVFGMHRPVLKK